MRTVRSIVLVFVALVALFSLAAVQSKRITGHRHYGDHGNNRLPVWRPTRRGSSKDGPILPPATLADSERMAATCTKDPVTGETKCTGGCFRRLSKNQKQQQVTGAKSLSDAQKFKWKKLLPIVKFLPMILSDSDAAAAAQLSTLSDAQKFKLGKLVKLLPLVLSDEAEQVVETVVPEELSDAQKFKWKKLIGVGTKLLPLLLSDEPAAVRRQKWSALSDAEKFKLGKLIKVLPILMSEEEETMEEFSDVNWQTVRKVVGDFFSKGNKDKVVKEVEKVEG